MQKEKAIKLISIIINLLIVVATTFIMIRAMVVGYRFGDIVVPPYQLSYFRYFTNLSNIYAALVALFLINYILIHFKDNDELPKWVTRVQLGSTTGVALTFLTVLFFLAPTYAAKGNNYFVMFMDDMIFTHFLTPVLSVVVFIFFTKHHKVNYKEALFGVIPMAIYSCIYSPLVLANVWDDFYGFTFGGNWWAIFLALPIMLCVTYLISWLLSLTTYRRQK